MPAQILNATGKLVQISIQGMLRKADYDRMIAISREAIAREGRIRVLVTLDGFAGWERHEGWGDVSFMMDDGEQIEKIAIVGDENWRDDAFVFTAAGLRPTAIEFFPPSGLADAQKWLSE
jgi:hypothetical protein